MLVKMLINGHSAGYHFEKGQILDMPSDVLMAFREEYYQIMPQPKKVAPPQDQDEDNEDDKQETNKNDKQMKGSKNK